MEPTKFLDSIKKITDSYLYIAGVNLFILLCWAANLLFLAIAVFIIALFTILLTQKNINGILPFFASIIFCVHDTGNGAWVLEAPAFWNTVKIIFYCFIPLFVAAVIFFFKRSGREVRTGRIFPILVIFFIFAFFGGAGTAEYTAAHAFTLLGYGAALVALYIFFYSAFDFKAENFKKYFAQSFLAAALVVGVQTGISYARLGYVFTGWGIGNTTGQVLALFLPFAFYLIYLCRKSAESIVYYASALFIIAMIYLSGSRTAMVAAAVTIALVCAVLLFKDKILRNARRIFTKTNLLILLAAGAGALVLCFVLRREILGLLGSLSGSDDVTSGRIGLWKDGLKAFLEAPIFGKGFFYKGAIALTEVQDGFLFMYWYHNTIIQIAVNMGVVGLVALVLFTFKKYQTYLFKADFFSFFIFIALVAGEIEGMLDIHSVTLAYNIFVLMFIACGEQLADKEDGWIAAAKEQA